MRSEYHRLLGVADDASPADLKAAFRKLAHRYHPDVSTEEGATEKFIAIVKAYRALTGAVHSNKSRQAADRSSEQSAPDTTAASGKESARSPSTKGKDCHIDVHVSIEELYWGVELKINPSSLCLGRRSKKGWKNSGLLNVKVRRGTRNGERLRLRGQGESGQSGGEAGDIYLTIQLKPHPRYEVSGDDLYVDMPVSRWEAREGAVIDVITPGGRVEVDVPPGIGSGQSVRIPNRGLPRSAAEHGDLFAVARLVNVEARAQKLRKWPCVPHADALRWRPVGGRHGNTIDVRI